jgi:hypothetical protein
VTSLLILKTQCNFIFIYLRLLSLCDILANDRMSLSSTIAASPRQRSHSKVLVQRNSWPHVTVSDLRLLQLGGPGPCIYIPQEQGGPVIPPDTEFPFFVISYNSQGYGEGIRPRLNTGLQWVRSRNHYKADDHSASLCWCEVPIWDLRPFFFWQFGFVDVGRPLWREDGSVVYSVGSVIVKKH